jgi:hypothetical protein
MRDVRNQMEAIADRPPKAREPFDEADVAYVLTNSDSAVSTLKDAKRADI